MATLTANTTLNFANEAEYISQLTAASVSSDGGLGFAEPIITAGNDLTVNYTGTAPITLSGDFSGTGDVIFQHTGVIPDAAPRTPSSVRFTGELNLTGTITFRQPTASNAADRLPIFVLTQTPTTTTGATYTIEEYTCLNLEGSSDTQILIYGNIDVQGDLKGRGQINGNVTTAASPVGQPKLVPGGIPGTALTVNGNLTVNTGSSVWTSFDSAGTAVDNINVIGTSRTVTLADEVQFYVYSFDATITAGTYPIIQGGTLTHQVESDDLNLPTDTNANNGVDITSTVAIGVASNRVNLTVS